MKDQFLFVYSLLVIHTQQVFYSHKKPTIREWIHLQLVGNILIVLTCIYILYILYQFNPNTNSIQIPIHPIQTKPIQSINIQHPNQISCGRSIHDTNNILTSSMVILLHHISIHQPNSIQSKYQFIQQFQLLNNQHV